MSNNEENHMTLNIELVSDGIREIFKKVACDCRSCKYDDGWETKLHEVSFYPCGKYDEENGHFTEGLLADKRVKLFDLTKSKFSKGYLTQSFEPLANLRRHYVTNGPNNIPNGRSGLNGIELLYRDFPISWCDFPYLNAPVPCVSGSTNVAFVEHGDVSRVTAEQIFENDRYNRIMGENFKFAFHIRHMEMTSGITGFYKGPGEFGNRPGWSHLWQIIRDSRTSVTDFVRRMSIESNKDHMAFHQAIKSDIQKFHDSLRLDQPNIWKPLSTCTYIEEIG